MAVVLVLYPRQGIPKLPVPSPNIYSQQQEHFHGNQCTISIQDLHCFFGPSSNFAEGLTWQPCHLFGGQRGREIFLWATYIQSVSFRLNFILETQSSDGALTDLDGLELRDPPAFRCWY